MSSSPARAETSAAAADLVTWFQTGWSSGSYESFCRLIAPRLAPDARMVQPLLRPHRGVDAFCRGIAPLWAAMPDIRANVLDWRGDDQTVFIEFHLEGTLGGRRLRLHVTDRFTQSNGIVTERVSFFDPTPVLVAALRNPRALVALATMRRRGRALYAATFPAGAP